MQPTDHSEQGLFSTVLVANRGEIAVRVIRTLRALGVRSIAVFSDADAGAAHVRAADVAVRIGSAPAAESYLSIPALIAAARQTGAEAIHPGYGFLSENTAFAAACAEAGIVFVGPPPAAIEAMGDKIRAKRTVEAVGVPVVPGRHEPGMSDADVTAAAAEVGYPVLLKPSAGGGGKGMREVYDAGRLAEAITSARREARGSFGDDTLLVERLVTRPRHIEIQLIADTHGHVVHLAERECSLQRRHQKVVEEAPSVLLDAATRERMGAAAVEAARAVGYTGAGTVEFIVSADRPEEFFFLEMNTRLQVEHPVTELAVSVGTTPLDLVEWQLRVAAGQPLGFAQDDVRITGHAVEARVYAEDPARGFLPAAGRVVALREPAGPGVRVDSGLDTGTVVGTDYDPMLAKVIAHGVDRPEALRRLDAALAGTTILGLHTNVSYLRDLLADDDVRAGRLDTGLIARRPAPVSHVDDGVYAAAVLAATLRRQPATPVVDPFVRTDGWRLGAPAWTVRRLRIDGGDPVEVRSRGPLGAMELSIGAGDAFPATVEPAPDGVRVTVHGVVATYDVGWSGDTLWLGREGRSWAVQAQDPAAVDAAAAAGDGALVSPMPGTVTVVRAAVGDTVAAGQPLVVVEAMKMEHAVVAPFDGTVAEVHVRAGQQVPMDAPLVLVEAAG